MVAILFCGILGIVAGYWSARRGYVVLTLILAAFGPTLLMVMVYAEPVRGGPAGSNVVLFTDQVGAWFRSAFNVIAGSVAATMVAGLGWLIGYFVGRPTANKKRDADAPLN